MTELMPTDLTRLQPVPARDRGLAGNLPAPLISLIGRDAEIAAACSLLQRDDLRLLTLTGPGGVGKTQLALAVARKVGGAFADGTIFMPLAPLSDPMLVPSAIAQTLGVRDSGVRPLLDGLYAVLRERELLLVLDNFEHVTAAAPLVADLLIGNPRLKVLITSRELLHLTGEHALMVRPLEIPKSGQSLSSDDLTDFAAIRLFVTRAQEVKPEFALTGANGEAVADICRSLDGLPLAIELAAARVRVLEPSGLLGHLTNRLQILTGGHRDAPERLQTMRHAIAWSYDLLAPQEQLLFRRLSVFVGGFTLSGAEAIAADESSILDLLTSLVDKSLIQQTEQTDGEPRFSLLETIREFGLERLKADNELDQARRAHALWCLTFVENVAPEFIGPETFTPEGAAMLSRLAAESENVRAALEWTSEHSEAEIALRLVFAYRIVWFARGQFREGRKWSEEALAVAGETSPALRARMLMSLSWFTLLLDDPNAARCLAEESLTVAQESGESASEFWALTALGYLEKDANNLEQAGAWHVEALAVARAMSDRRWEPQALDDLGDLAQSRGDFEKAAGSYEAALSIARSSGDREAITRTTRRLALVFVEQGNTQRAAALLREALDLARAVAHDRYVVQILSDSAFVGAATGKTEAAARILSASAVMRAALGTPGMQIEQTVEQQRKAAIRCQIGEAAFEAAFEAGANLSVENALDEADILLVEVAGAPDPLAITAPAAPAGLTSREIEVLRLVAQERSNREIAELLFISVPTVKRHITTILGKLGVSSRSDASAYAHVHGLG
ncbi:MAG: tetratricopeptide repeat protein [Thermomicrobiales bacterium]